VRATRCACSRGAATTGASAIRRSRARGPLSAARRSSGWRRDLRRAPPPRHRQLYAFDLLELGRRGPSGHATGRPQEEAGGAPGKAADRHRLKFSATTSTERSSSLISAIEKLERRLRQLEAKSRIDRSLSSRTRFRPQTYLARPSGGLFLHGRSRSGQSGLTSAPTIPHFVHTIRGINEGTVRSPGRWSTFMAADRAGTASRAGGAAQTS
jgi:hypothetical protein